MQMLVIIHISTALLTILIFNLLHFTNAVLVNVTVDDTFPDPLTGRSIAYLPEGNQWKAGANCSVCTAAIDRQFMYNQTWYDGTYYPDSSGGPLTATLTFNGTAIYVFCALSESNSSPFGYTNMSFYIDEEFVYKFEREPAGLRNTFVYNVSVYSNTSLSPGEHKVVLQNGQYGNQGNNSLVLLDYMVYSYDDGNPPPPEPPNVSDSRKRRARASVIVGVAVGATAAIAALGALVWILRRRKYQSIDNKSVVPDPFMTPSSASLQSNHPQRAVDAGPIEVGHDEPLLPPDYLQIFTGPTSAPSHPRRKA